MHQSCACLSRIIEEASDAILVKDAFQKNLAGLLRHGVGVARQSGRWAVIATAKYSVLLPVHAEGPLP
jgi:hypothetical protein